jgi:type III secretory pathway component EscU
MQTGSSLLILLAIFAVGIFLGEYLSVDYIYLLIGFFICLIIYCINFYLAYKIGMKEMKIRKIDVDRYWKIIEANPNLMRDTFKVGFKQ